MNNSSATLDFIIHCDLLRKTALIKNGRLRNVTRPLVTSPAQLFHIFTIFLQEHDMENSK